MEGGAQRERLKGMRDRGLEVRGISCQALRALGDGVLRFIASPWSLEVVTVLNLNLFI